MFILSLLFNAHMNALGELKCSYGGDRVGSPASDKQPGIARLARASELELVIRPPGLFFSRLSESPCA